MALHESGEMYLETIHMLSAKLKAVRSIDVVKEMGFSKPSVSRAVNSLKDDNYIDIDESGFITLTESGLEIALKICERHNVLTESLIAIGVPEEIAAEDACKMEHIISDTTFNAIKAHFKK